MEKATNEALIRAIDEVHIFLDSSSFLIIIIAFVKMLGKSLNTSYISLNVTNREEFFKKYKQ